jgi:hypothetical protein
MATALELFLSLEQQIFATRQALIPLEIVSVADF